MKWVVAAIGGFIAALAAIIVGWKKVGEKSGEVQYHKEKFRDAQQIAIRVTKPLPSSSEFCASAIAALRKRLREAKSGL